MTEERRQQILGHLKTCTADELVGFAWGLRQQGEHTDPDVMRALAAKGVAE